LLQEAAYASLLRDERVLIHARIVDVLRTSAPEEIDDRPEVVAYHCDGAEQYALAAQYWLAAGKAAAARGSVSVAVSCFKMGLSSLSNLARNPSLDRLKFELLLNLGPAAMAESGYAAQEGLETFQAAHALLHCSQNSQEELQVLIGLFNVHFGRGELKKALEVGTQTHQRLLVGFGGYPVLMGQAHCYMGNLGQARDCLEQAIAIYNPAVDGDLGLFCGANIVATSFLAKVEFALGRLKRSAELTEEAMRLAEADGHPVGIAIAQLGRLFLLMEANEFAAGERVAEEAYKHASAHDLGNYKLWLQFFRAALSLQRDPAKALERMQEVLAALDKAGTLMFRPAQLAILAGGLAAVGRPGDAMAAVDAGLDVAERTDGREAIPALLRMRARMLLKADPAKARAALELSLREARSQGALMEELRTATLVSRTTKGTEAQQKGRTLLQNVLSRMPADFPHPDLNFAARVLAELSE
jgi:tetratricopeptide (TPR) repeat protein